MDVRKIADARYRNALSLAEKMRKKFLQSSNSKRASHRSELSIAEPVWLATSALVA
jgi:hypothetical protein